MAAPTEPPISLSPPGEGDIEVTGPLGRGAMGEVLRASDPRLHREVALKRLDTRHRGDPSATRRFVTEAQLTAQLDHPGVVPVHAMSVGDEGPSYAMKLVRGRTLKAYFDEAASAKKLPANMALPARLELFLGICEPVAYAHARGVIHRDLKPANIMVGSFGEVFVMDWGVARLSGKEGASTAPGSSDDSDGTVAGEAIGTPSYMSPEQARGENDSLDGRSDQYALGLILYELATLKRARASIKAGIPMIVAASRGHVEPIVAGREPISRELRAVIRKATAPNAGDRYADVTALANDVRHVIRGEAVAAAPDSTVQRLGRWIGRHRERVATIAMLGTLVTALSFGALVALALAVREWDRAEAAARAARLVTITTTTADRAREIDQTFLRYEGLLRGLVGAAERAIRHDEAGTVYLWTDFNDPSRRPADLVASQVYGGPTSFDHPDIVYAVGTRGAEADRKARALASLVPELKRAVVESAPANADPRSMVLQVGAPIVWSYVATADGVMTGYPGTGVYPPDYDPRARPWYAQATTGEGPRWGRPYVDESGMGLLVSCTSPLRAQDGSLLGVAGVDLTVRYVVATFLAPGELPAEAFLVDAEGNIVVRTGERAAPVGEAIPFPRWGVVTAERSGHALDGDTLVAWSRLEAMPWTYVLSGNAAELLE